ncbi:MULTISPECIES: RNA chaperone Hfq [Bacillaceae]|uniref:RNA chaperone Hfq n=1 Tax=Bacillaceae TaxID=186817 RepID=UPI001BDF3AAE|nr:MULTISPECIES: RNA chaperone Hfq [Bacillaceae]MDX8362688.1 RNA chaperone Hfq [Cytobacillus sp. IB215316]
MKSNKNQINQQDTQLLTAKENQSLVTIILVSGFQFRCKVIDFDIFTVLAEVEGKQQLVYKHAISTVMEGSSIVKKQATRK